MNFYKGVSNKIEIQTCRYRLDKEGFIKTIEGHSGTYTQLKEKLAKGSPLYNKNIPYSELDEENFIKFMSELSVKFPAYETIFNELKQELQPNSTDSQNGND